MAQSLSRYMGSKIKEPTEEEKSLSTKKMQLEIETISVANEVARKREERDNLMAKESMPSMNLADLIKIAATPGLSPSMKEEAEAGIRVMMSEMLSTTSTLTLDSTTWMRFA
jgi:hypothetical protein